MKTSNFVTFAMVLALGALVGCGKKNSSNSNPAYVCGQNLNCSNFSGNPSEVITQNEIVALQTQLATQFTNSDLSPLRPMQYVVFQKGSYSSSQARIFGINLGFNVNQYNRTCDFYEVAQVSGAVPNQTLNYRSALNASCNQQVPLLNASGSYTTSANADLARALNTYAVSIVTRGIMVPGFNNNQLMTAYSIYRQDGAFAGAYEEIVVVPSLPSFMNPVVIYSQRTGSLKMLNGVQIQ